MNEEDQKRMWLIDGQLQLGERISYDESVFFNENYELMLSEMADNYNHWKNRTSKV